MSNTIDKQQVYAYLDKRIELMQSLEAHDEILKFKRLVDRGTFDSSTERLREALELIATGNYGAKDCREFARQALSEPSGEDRNTEQKMCTACSGTGYDHSGGFPDHMTPCSICHGSGASESGEDICDWCGEPTHEVSHPHMFDMAIGKKMCRGCWDHDRDVYKGSYGEDICEFKPIREGRNEG